MVRSKFWPLFLGALGLFGLYNVYIRVRTTEIHYFDHASTEQVLKVTILEKQRLNGLIELLFATDNFAYTLLGVKPVSQTTYHNFLPYNRFSWRSWNRYNRTLLLGWKTWEKHKHLFPKFPFWSEDSQRHPGAVSIFLVHKQSFDKVIIEHKTLFQDLLDRQITDSSDLLNEAKYIPFEDEILKGNQVLLGIVLGYGQNNAEMFVESCKTLTPTSWVWSEEEWGEIWAGVPTGMTKTDYYLNQYSCPSFAGDPVSEESMELKKRYLEAKEQILDYYQGKDILEATLSLLAGFAP
jgi:hypothetical protein